MERHTWTIYFVLLVKMFHNSQGFNRSSLKNSIIVIKKNPYGNIIIKSETVNMNSTTLFDDIHIEKCNASVLQNFGSIENDTSYNSMSSGPDALPNINSIYSTGYNTSSNTSCESDEYSRFSSNHIPHVIANVTLNSTMSPQNVTTRRRSLLRRLLEKLLWPFTQLL